MTYSTDCGCASCEGARAAHQEIERLNAMMEVATSNLEASSAAMELAIEEVLTRDATIERVRALIPKWVSDRATYPLDDVRAPIAFLAVKACEKELATALDPTP